MRVLLSHTKDAENMILAFKSTDFAALYPVLHRDLVLRESGGLQNFRDAECREAISMASMDYDSKAILFTI